jgi:hypothetical protein
MTAPVTVVRRLLRRSWPRRRSRRAFTPRSSGRNGPRPNASPISAAPGTARRQSKLDGVNVEKSTQIKLGKRSFRVRSPHVRDAIIKAAHVLEVEKRFREIENPRCFGVTPLGRRKVHLKEAGRVGTLPVRDIRLCPVLPEEMPDDGCRESPRGPIGIGPYFRGKGCNRLHQIGLRNTLRYRAHPKTPLPLPLRPSPVGSVVRGPPASRQAKPAPNPAPMTG